MVSVLKVFLRAFFGLKVRRFLEGVAIFLGFWGCEVKKRGFLGEKNFSPKKPLFS